MAVVPEKKSVMKQSKNAYTRSLKRFAWSITSKKLIVRNMNSDYFSQQH